MSSFKVSTQITTRFSDTDAMGHVNNSRFFSFFEEGRVAYFRKLAGESQTIKDTLTVFPFILASIQCNFLLPVFCGDELEVSLGVTRMGNKSFTIDYEIARLPQREKVAQGTSTLVMYDYKTAQACAIPQEWRKKIEQLEGKNFSAS